MSGTQRKFLALLCASFVFLAILSFSFLAPLSEAAAQTRSNYDPAGGLVGSSNIGCSGFDCQLCNVMRAVNNIISFLFYLGTIIAVLLFIYAGAKMMMAGGDSGAVSEAKNIFWNIIIGVVIMLCAYLVVDTVLKSVLSGNAQRYGPWNEIQCVALPTTPPPPGGGPGGVRPVPADEVAAREALRGIPINKGPCPEGVPYSSVAGGCTNVAGLPQNAIQGIISMNSACGGCVTITGGTEGGHASHGPGNAIVDISRTPSALQYVQYAPGSRRAGSRGNDPVYVIGNDRYVIESNHIHIEFGAAR